MTLRAPAAWDLVLLANKRWAEIADRIGAEHCERNQIADLIEQVQRAHQRAEGVLAEADESAPGEEMLPYWYAEQITYAFAHALRLAFAAAQTPEDDIQRTLAAVALHTDRRGVASLAEDGGTLLAVAQLGYMGSDACYSIGHALGAQFLYASEGILFLYRVPASAAGEWPRWRDAAYGPEDTYDRRPAAERYAALEQLRALAAAHA